MRSEAMPIIRMQVDSMSASIVSHLGAYGSELGDAIQKEIERQMESNFFDKEIEKQVRQTVTQCIENYFAYGDGRSNIQQAVNDGLNKRKWPWSK